MTDSSERIPFPTEGRLLGLDYGSRRVGMAISDTEQRFAAPFEIYMRSSPAGDAMRLKNIVEEHWIRGIVVGLPVHMSGDEGGKAAEARAFGEWVAEVTELPVRYWDERYSTAIAEAHLWTADFSHKKRKARLDKVAAQVILQAFLDADDRELPPPSLK